MKIRSIFPQINLAAAVRYIEKNREAVLQSGVYKRNNLLPLLGFSNKSGAGQTAIVALMHYGFIEKSNNDGYYFSKAAKKIARTDTSSTSRYDTLKEALSYPPIFNDIREAYESRDKGIQPERVLRQRGVKEDKIEHVLATYHKSLDFVGRQTPSDLQPAATLAEAQLNSEVAIDNGVTVDFGNGMVVSVPKKLVLDAYLNELQKIQRNLP